MAKKHSSFDDYVFRQFRLKLSERQGHEVAYAVNDIDTPLAIEKNVYGLAEAGLGLNHHLSAGATGRDGILGEISVLVAGGNGQHLHSLVRILRPSGENGTTFGTDASGEGRIFLVTATNDGVVTKQDAGTHVELGVRGVGAFCGLYGNLNRLTVDVGQLVQLTFFDLDIQF